MPKMGAENSYLPCITKSTEEKIELSPVYHKRIKQRCCRGLTSINIFILGMSTCT
jgi:hypothetical protein